MTEQNVLEQYNNLVKEFGEVNTYQFYMCEKKEIVDAYVSLKPEHQKETLANLKEIMESPGFVKFVF